MTFRENMNIYKMHADDDLIRELRKFGLWTAIEEAGGLDALMTEKALSYGQRQLFCFIRASLQESHVFILDEPSSR